MQEATGATNARHMEAGIKPGHHLQSLSAGTGITGICRQGPAMQGHQVRGLWLTTERDRLVSYYGSPGI